MSPCRPTFSLIVPTRQRITQLRSFLDSLAATAAHPSAIEVVLVVDADDRDSIEFCHEGLPLSHVVVAPGQTMGRLNMAGYEASSGEYLMLLNDDVLARTPGWDDKILARCRRFPDGVFLIHANDTLMGKNLCTFPIVSRVWCELAGGVCPREYIRYRIDDHIEDVFNLLGVLGQRRTIYLPDVVFEHLNCIELPDGPREYHSDPDVLALDAPLFLSLFPARKELAVKLLAHVGGTPQALAAARQRLKQIKDPFSLRVPGRLRIESDVPLAARAMRRVAATWERSRKCFQRKGIGGLTRAAARRMRLLRVG
jgi:glycosyltransferase involved in cell wall biosynthesis